MGWAGLGWLGSSGCGCGWLGSGWPGVGWLVMGASYDGLHGWSWARWVATYSSRVMTVP